MTAFAEPLTLAGIVADAARRFGEAEALVAPDGRASFAALDRESSRIARALAAAGIGPGDQIGICAGNSVRWVTLFYGIAKAGAVSVPINTRLKPGEIGYQLRQAKVRLLFLADALLSIDFVTLFGAVAKGMAGGFPQADLPELRQVVLLGARTAPHCTGFSAFLEAGEGHALPAPPGPDAPALIQFTSGTTSLPKGAVLAHASLVRNAQAVAARMGLGPGDRYLSARPFFHVAGTTLSIVLSAAVGATLVTMTRFLAEDAVALAEAERCTYFSGNDTMFLMLLDRPDAREKCRFTGGWAAASPVIVERAMDELGARDLVVAYGLSEASPNVAVSDRGDAREDRIAGWMRPHAGLKVRIAAEDGTSSPPGVPGEIQVRGWSVMQGYFDKPEETARSFSPDGYLRTGDLGVMRADGRLRFVGRLKDIIRVGGENVSPGEIEEVLLTHPQIAQAQVVGVPDPRLVEVPAAYLVLKHGASQSAEAIGSWARERLAGFKLPRHLVVVDSFDDLGMTASGKVQKNKLREDALTRFG